MVSLWSMHTTCALFINESQKALHADIKRLLEAMVARDAEWMHNDPDHSDCDRLNADSHLRRAAGSQPDAAGQRRGVVLGQWQRVLWPSSTARDRARCASQVMGVSDPLLIADCRF